MTVDNPKDGIHAMVPRVKMCESARKLRDTYARTPAIPLFRREFGFYSLERWKEQGIGFDSCGAGHQKWGDGATAALNPKFTFKLTKNMVQGDAHCEWVVERKK